MVIAFVAGVAILTVIGLLDARSTLALVVGPGAIAIVGFLDDHGAVDWKWRLAVQVCAAAFAVFAIGGMPSLTALGVTLPAGAIANVLAVIGLVWLCNLYNFMDGINGIAASEAVSACAGIVAVYLRLSSGSIDSALATVLAAAAAGFLIWNFPRGRIFMGDVGSGFLGFAVGVLAVRAASDSSPLFWSWMILLGVFIVDASVTLIRRAMRGARIHEAHKEHAYQKAAARARSHVPITLSVVAINAAWLLPWAIAVAQNTIDPMVGMGIAFTPLIAGALALRAGRPTD